jgi:excisionase family DNA binding protein
VAEELSTKDVATLEWWTVRELANLLRFDASTIRRWCENKRIDAAQLPGGTWRIHKSVVEKLQVDGMPEKRRIRTAGVPEEFAAARDYFDDEPSSAKARVRT